MIKELLGFQPYQILDHGRGKGGTRGVQREDRALPVMIKEKVGLQAHQILDHGGGRAVNGGRRAGWACTSTWEESR